MNRQITVLVAYYAAALGSAGCAPYFSVLLSEGGLSDSRIALSLAVLPLGILVVPLWAREADRRGSPSSLLKIATAGTFLCGLVLLVAPSASLMALALLPWSLLRAPHIPLADPITLKALGENRRQYGMIRAAGSVAFLGVAWAGGAARDVWPKAPLAISAAGFFLAFLLSFALPDDRLAAPRTDARQNELKIRDIVRSEAVFLGVGALHGVALVGFDNYWSLHADRAGLSSMMTGSGIAWAVLVETAVMMLGRPLLDRFGPRALLLAAVAAGLPHTLLTAALTGGVALTAAQGLRGVAFGAYWIGGVAWLSERAPPGHAATAQALLPVCSFGVGYLLCSTLAAVFLPIVGTAGLFGIFAGVEALALIATVSLLRETTRGD